MDSTPIWKHPINWSSPCEEEISFPTEIITSRDGSEQRIAQRVNPRVSHRWKSSARGRDFAAVDSRIAARQAQEIAFTDPFARAGRDFRLNGVANIGDTSLTLPATGKPSWFAVGKHRSWSRRERTRRDRRSRPTRSARSTTLAAPLENAFPAGTT